MKPIPVTYIRDFTMRCIDCFDRQSKITLVVSGLVVIIAVSLADYFMKDLSLFVFNLIPIFFVAWFVGLRVGVLISFCVVLSRLIIDLIETPLHAYPFTHYLTAAAEFIFFVVIVDILLALRNALSRERELARIDYLTGAANSRSFSESGRTTLEILRRYKRIFTLVYIDIDNFKNINDRFGHSVGDTVLRTVAQTIKDRVRIVDVVARLGGDEFGLLLPETGCESAQIVINRVRKTLQEVMQKNGWPITFSIGSATYLSPPASVDEMIRKADALMYSAKASGKNAIIYDCIGELA
jgi:diguanylate cyclase (GGDEF)-like protein